MPRFNTPRTTDDHLFIVTSLVPAALFAATLLAAVHVGKAEGPAPQVIGIGYQVTTSASA